MANATVSRLGQDNLAGDALALFLKVFTGEVLTTFQAATVALSRHRIRTIKSGKSGSFAVTGTTTASLHVPGTEIVGKTIAGSERIIPIDGLLLSDVFIASIDEAMNHYDVRSVYSSEMGFALAKIFDQHVLQTGVLAARAAATITGGFGGSSTVATTAKTDAAVLFAAIKSAAQKLDEQDIPDDGKRYCFLRPAQYSLLLDAPKIVNSDYVERSNGGVDTGNVFRVANVNIVKTNHLPITNVVDAALPKYSVDASTTAALVMHESAVGTVKLLDLAMESEYDIRRQGTLMVAKYAMGTDILRPEAAHEIKTA